LTFAGPPVAGPPPGAAKLPEGKPVEDEGQRHRHAGVLRRAPAPGAVRADRQGAGPRPGAADASGLGHGAHAPDEV